MARWKSPAARGEESNDSTLVPPADSPKIVTAAGLPPNAAMLSRTHSKPRTKSNVPKFPEASSGVSAASRSAGWVNQPNGPSR